MYHFRIEKGTLQYSVSIVTEDMEIIDEIMDLIPKEGMSQADLLSRDFKEMDCEKVGAGPIMGEVEDCINEGAGEIGERLLASDFMALLHRLPWTTSYQGSLTGQGIRC